MKTIQQILAEIEVGADAESFALLGRFCNELAESGWVFVHRSQIEGLPTNVENRTINYQPRRLHS